jgi:murein L,D-transpeptidase YcbB/YkuD
MVRRALKAIIGGGLFVALGVGGAQAYFADGPDFAIRGGAATTTLQLELGPVEIAIRDRLGLLEAATSLVERDIAGVIEFYEARGFLPAWTNGGGLTPGAVALIDRLAAADADGLDPRAYRTPSQYSGGTPIALAVADIMMSMAVAAYTREASAGRLDPRAVSREIDLSPDYPDVAIAVRSVAVAADQVAALDGFNPIHPDYLALRAELARLRDEDPVERIVIPTGPTLRLGDEGERVAVLRQRLDLEATDGEVAIFDEDLKAAVIEFQGVARLVTDGIVGPATIGALNGPNIDPVAEIIANMERWRWLPHDFGEFYVHVNVPEFMVRIVADDEVHHEPRVVVGKVSSRTTIFSDEIEHFIVNPFWYVPASIIAAEYMPILRSDPGYFNRNNYDVFARWNGTVSQVNPVQIDWSRLSASDVSMRQRPGPGNALGRIKFMFPNSHAIYLHDTPSKSLFQRDVRSFSHGCVRVMNPIDFADALLLLEQFDRSGLEALFGNTERQVNLDTHIPVHITYFTAVIDEAGNVQFKGDLYGYSATVRDQLGIGDAQIAAN